MSIKLDDLAALLLNTKPHITENPDGSLNLVFNPQSNDSPIEGIPAMAVHFELTTVVDGVKRLSAGISTSLANQVPEYAAQHMENVRFDLSTAPNPTLIFKFHDGQDTPDYFFKLALAEMIEQMDGLDIETDNNTLRISGTTHRIDFLLLRMADPVMESFLKIRAKSQNFSDTSNEDTVVPFIRPGTVIIG